MKPKRKIISLLLAICLVAGLLPATAFALDGDKTIMLGTSGISGFDDAKGGTGYDYIYFGSWTAQDTYTTSGPIKWRVLDDQTNFDSDSDGTNDAGLFLLSDQNLDAQPYHSSYTSITWEGSSLRTWLNGTFLNAAFSGDEQVAIADTNVYNKNNPLLQYIRRQRHHRQNLSVIHRGSVKHKLWV